MSDISTLVNRYFVQTSDLEIEGERVPDTSNGNQIQHLIDGHAYFGALSREIANLKAGGSNRYFYVANWWLGLAQGPEIIIVGPGSITSAWTADADASGLSPFVLDDGTGGSFDAMINELEDMAESGVDVRVFAWVSPLISTFREAAEFAKGLWVVNTHTLLSTFALSNRNGMQNKVVLNVLSHPLGAMHLKMVVCGDDTSMRAYVSGLDLVSNRIAGPTHAGGKIWHDVGAKIEGPAAGAIYDYYLRLWNEQIDRSPKTFRVSGHEFASHTDETPQVSSRSVPPLSTPGTQHVQVLRTAPQMNFSFFETSAVPVDCFKRLVTGFRQDELSFADDGIFEFRAGLRKAIRGARNYVYIEDQAFMGLEIMEWINDRLIQEPNLKVIMLYGADPADPPNTFLPHGIKRMTAAVTNADDRVAFYKRGGGVVVHSKVTIVDDLWAAVGSANFMRRSLYTDGETSIGVLDEATPSFAQKLRKDLWGEHCGLAPGSSSDPLLDLSEALGLWNTSWGTAPAGITLRPELERMKIPFEFANPPGPGQWPGSAPPAFDQLAYDRNDPDSRQEF